VTNVDRPPSDVAQSRLKENGQDPMTAKWQRENPEGTLWSATMADGQHGWLEIEIERSPDGWDWVVNHDRRFWGRENTLDQAKIAVAAQLALTGEHVPRCEIRPFTENEDGGYLISFPDFPGVVASGAMPEEAIRRARDALEVYRSTMRRREVPGASG
jgi:predicted RNase H-like HicB family nuclease